MFDSSRERDPLEFVVGSGQLIGGFDAAVRGLAVGESATARLEPVDAYGDPIPELIAEVPIDTIPAEVVQQLFLGAVVPLANGAQAIVTNITDTFITLDANHHLAGETLTFEIELVEIIAPAPDPNPSPCPKANAGPRTRPTPES